jgi:tetratricopeptide (TPR) repeat protein
MNESQKSLAEARFDKLVTVLISSVAILVAITAFLQNYASTLSEEANRHAQELAIQSTTRRVTGAVQYSYDWQSAFQTWREVDLQLSAAQLAGDTAAEKRYTALRDKLTGLSPLLTEPYFDTQNNWPLASQYESDLYYVESTRLAELYAAESAVGRAWSDTADRFVIQITLLTVALSLYGLSLTIKGRMRWLFVVLGSGIVGFCALWLGLELLLSKPKVSETAINAYAKGVGLAYVGKDEEAIASFDEAISIKPDYANAFFARGDSYFYLGDYERTAADYEAARAAGRDDISVNWNLGWNYYLLGRYDEAILANDRVLSANPAILGVRANQALTRLAQGDLAGAQHEYDSLIQEAARQVAEARANQEEPPASLWYYLDASAADLQSLIDQLDNNPKGWTFAPPTALILGDQQAIKSLAYEQLVRIKESTLALEYTGGLPPAQEVMSVTPFAFGFITEFDDNGDVAKFEAAPDALFSSNTPFVDIEFAYSGPAPTQQIMWRVYYNGTEDVSFRSVWEPDLSGSDTWYKTVGFTTTDTFVLSPGEFFVELYVDYHLVQTGTFYVLDE